MRGERKKREEGRSDWPTTINESTINRSTTFIHSNKFPFNVVKLKEAYFIFKSNFLRKLLGLFWILLRFEKSYLLLNDENN